MLNLAYCSVVNQNPHLFVPGQVISRRELCKLFKLKKVVHSGEFTKVQHSNLTLVHAQTEINRILRLSGLRMKSKNYYSKFVICDKEETKSAILLHQEKAESHKNCSDALEKAMAIRIKDGTWGTCRSVVPRLTAQLQKYPPSPEYQLKKERIKPW